MLKFVSYVLIFIVGFAVCATLYHASPPTFQSNAAAMNGPNSTASIGAVAPTGSSSAAAGPGSTIYAVAAVEPSVVNIDITGKPVPTTPMAGPFGLPFRGFDGNPDGSGGEALPQGVASGVIISADGFILTNNHVAGDASSLMVTLHDGRRLPARVIGLDPKSDLAVIKVNASNLPVPHFGHSTNVKVGQWVIAVGDPLGIGTTATAGIVSAIRSPFPIRDKIFPEIIQTDAAINPGNSGGALADLDGNIVGINAAIASTGGGSIGIGFTIPIDMALQHAQQLIKSGAVTYPWLGIGYVEKVDSTHPVQGALVSAVAPGGPAARAGLQPGDVITGINGHAIDEPEKVNFYVLQHQPGQQVRLTVLRAGHERTLQVTLSTMPASLENAQMPQAPDQAPNQGPDQGP